MRALLVLLSATLLAQTPDAPLQLGPGVTPPRVRKKVEPDYPKGAAAIGLEATVVVEVVIDSTGVITTVNPLRLAGRGFDESAVACVKKWRFHPAEKDGRPVAVHASIEVNFRLLGRDQAYLKNRNLMLYNGAVSKLQDPDPAIAAKALDAILALSKLNYPPAQYSEGVLRITGQKLPKDPARGMPLLLSAAEERFPAAVGQAGYYFYEGRYVKEDKPRGLQMMKDAAKEGSIIAQLFLGDLERDTDPTAAAHYLRLCAAQKQSSCQTLLAELLLKQTRDRWPEAIAWLEVAARQQHQPAQKLLDTHSPNLTPVERERVAKLRPLLVAR